MTEKFIPTKEERAAMRELAFGQALKVTCVLKKFLGKFKAEPVGSTVKGTWVKGSKVDIDIYISSECPDALLTEVMKSPEYIDGEVLQSGTLKVWRTNANGFPVDLVFMNTKDGKVDTLKHAGFFNSHLTEEQKDDVVRLKVLFKSRGLYGAEQGGITGVALEELVRTDEDFDTVISTLRFKDAWDEDAWFLQDPILKDKRNLLASIIPIRRKQISNLVSTFPIDFVPGVDKITLQNFTASTFTEQWMKRFPNTGFIMTFFRQGEIHVDFSKFLGAANVVLRQMHDLERECFGEADVFVDDNAIIVAVSLPQQLTVFKTKFMCIVGRDKTEIDTFKEKHKLWIQHDEDNIMTIVPRKFTLPWNKFIEMMQDKLKVV